MIFIPVKPVSVNKQYFTPKGTTKRMKTKEAREFQRLVKLYLPKDLVIYDFMRFNVTYHFRSHGSDISNPTKLLVDTLSEFYNFNDNRIYVNHEIKQVVGDDEVEGFSFSIENFYERNEIEQAVSVIDEQLAMLYTWAWKDKQNDEYKYELKRRLDICRKALNYYNEKINEVGK